MTRTAVRPFAWANLRVPAAGGVDLATDVHLPADGGVAVPVVVTRTPYGRSAHLAEGREWRRRGFGFVVQDVRGRHDSDGTWAPYRNERQDGAALLDWIADQPWCDGRVVTYGGSYSGYTAWTAAVERPEVVAAVVSLGPSMGLHRTKYTPSGILRLAEHVGWWLERGDGRTSRDGLREIVFGELPDLLAGLPVAGIGDRLGVRLPGLGEALALAPDRPPAEAVEDGELAAVPAAVLHVAGWYDLLLTETLHLWQVAGAARTPRPARRLVLGPWGHDLGMAGTTVVGDREHGAAARRGIGALAADWLGAVLAGDGKPAGGADVFVLGEDRWVHRDTWPPAGSELRLHPTADGRLDHREPPAGEAGYAYDPADPFPSFLPGADRAPAAGRADAVRFGTGPLAAPMTIEGVAVLHLTAGTTGDGTDWIARLLERRPDGRLFELATASAVAPAAGTARFRLPFTAVAATLHPGTELVLELTSSDFPYLARHLSTGPDRLHGTATRPARQRVVTGTGATVLVLPVAGERS